MAEVKGWQDNLKITYREKRILDDHHLVCETEGKER